MTYRMPFVDAPFFSEAAIAAMDDARINRTVWGMVFRYDDHRFRYMCPDYVNDLDAIHDEVEPTLLQRDLLTPYRERLLYRFNGDPNAVLCASARDRCLAALYVFFHVPFLEVTTTGGNDEPER